MFLCKDAVSALVTGTALSLVTVQATAQEASVKDGSLLAQAATPSTAGQASAQDTSDSSGILQEIVVTAQKRSERLMDVPLSITAASGEQLIKQGITETSQLAKLVPGFTYQDSNYGTPLFTIRGIGFQDGSLGAQPTVTTYVDQVPLSYPLMNRGATLDLERVEVLKGPQGTLFGQNATGGAINYIAAKPTPDLSAGYQVGYGRFNAVDAEAFISGPLSDTLRARVAVRGESADGWQESVTRSGDEWGKKEFYNGRVLVDWTPTDRLSFTLNLSGWQDNSELPANQLLRVAPVVPANPLTQFIFDALAASPVATDNARQADWSPGLEHIDNTFYLTSLSGNWEISDQLTLTSITAYSKLVAHMPYDPDGVAFENLRNIKRDGLLTSFTQELRLAGTMDPLRWMVGANYQRDVGNQSVLQVNEASNGVLPTPTGVIYQDTSAYIFNQQPTFKSGFASLEYDLTDQFTLMGSARYTDHVRDFTGCIRDAAPGPNATGTVGEGFLGLSELLSGSPSVMGPNNCLTLNDTTFKPEQTFKELKENNVSWRVGVNWKPTSDTLAYLSAVKGYKSGTFSTAPGVLASEFDPVGQESVMSFEVGVKQSFGRTVEVSAAVYHYDYSDKQLVGVEEFPVFGRLPKLVNIPESRIVGAELAVTARPIDSLRLQGGVSYVDSEVREDPGIPLDPLGNLVTYVGEAFPNTPKWQIVGDAEYSMPLSGRMDAYVGGSVSYRSESNAAFGENPEFELPSYTLVDLRAGVEWDNWRVQIWGRNVTDKYYRVNVGAILDTIARTSGMPATYGATVGYRF